MESILQNDNLQILEIFALKIEAVFKLVVPKKLVTHDLLPLPCPAELGETVQLRGLRG